VTSNTAERRGARIAGRTAADLGAEVATHPHGRVPRELRTAHILALATDLFIERGYAQASMDELARRAGVSKPVVYDLVGSKDEVFRRVMAAAADELAERVTLAVATADDFGAQLRAGAAAFFAFVDERSEAWGALMHGTDVPVTEAVAAIRSNQARLLSELFRGAARDGGASEDARLTALVDLVAHAVNGAFEAAAAWWHEHPDVHVDEVADIVINLVQPGLLHLGTSITDPGGTS
jgi:AcrR family transcriptional regulator